MRKGSHRSRLPRARNTTAHSLSTTAAEQDAVLAGVDETPFFALVRTHTIQGTFCDPRMAATQTSSAGISSGIRAFGLNVTAADQRMASPNRSAGPRTTTRCSQRRIDIQNLKPIDVVIVGMGAAGGVAALPLAQAGLSVIGLEAGGWLTAKDFAPDELRNNYRAWPHSVQKANREIPTHRPNASAPYSPRPAFHPMMNGVGGTSLHYWAQSWRLADWDFKVVSETTKRYGRSRIPAGSTVEDWPFGIEELERYYDIVEHELGVSGKAGNLNGTIDRRGNIFEGAAASRVSDAAAARGRAGTTGWRSAARGLGWNPFPGPGGDQYPNRTKACGLRVSRFLRAWWLSREREGINGRHHYSESTKDRTSRRRHDAHVTQVNVDGRGKVTGVTYVKGGAEYFQPRSRRVAGDLHLRNRADAAALEVESVSKRACE